MRLLPASLWPRFLKRRLPTSLWGRSLLIIVLPVLVMQVAVTWAFFDMHWQTVTARLSDGLAGEIAWAAESWRDDPTPENLAVIAERAERSMSLSIALQEGATLPAERRRDELEAAADARQRTLALAGPLFAPTLFRLGEAARLLLIAHHLIVDGVSWRILLEDLVRAYEQAVARQPIALPPRTS